MKIMTLIIDRIIENKMRIKFTEQFAEKSEIQKNIEDFIRSWRDNAGDSVDVILLTPKKYDLFVKKLISNYFISMEVNNYGKMEFYGIPVSIVCEEYMPVIVSLEKEKGKTVLYYHAPGREFRITKGEEKDFKTLQKIPVDNIVMYPSATIPTPIPFWRI